MTVDQTERVEIKVNPGFAFNSFFRDKHEWPLA
mgnify:CR=1 FL=1